MIEDMYLKKVDIYLFNFKVEDHRAIITDFKLSDFSNNKSPIYDSDRRRLIYKFLSVVLKHNERAIALALKDKLKKKLDKLKNN